MRSIVKLCIILQVMLSCGIAHGVEKVFFYHTDPAGTPLAMTDTNGNVVWRAVYKPFGEEQTVTGTVESNEKFVGKEKDKETGLYYFGARYMKDNIGRFISPDPIGPVDPRTSKTNYEMLTNPQKLNLYAYSLNNPYKYVDPDGRDGILVKYIGYRVSTGLGFKLPLGHSAVIAVDPHTGVTKYFEYGRYDKDNFGEVRTRKVPNVVIGQYGKPTKESLNKLYEYSSMNYGQSKPVEATYYNDADFQKVVDFATDRKDDKDRKPYGLLNNNCKTFATEAIEAGRKEE